MTDIDDLRALEQLRLIREAICALPAGLELFDQCGYFGALLVRGGDAGVGRCDEGQKAVLLGDCCGEAWRWRARQDEGGAGDGEKENARNLARR